MSSLLNCQRDSLGLTEPPPDPLRTKSRSIRLKLYCSLIVTSKFLKVDREEIPRVSPALSILIKKNFNLSARNNILPLLLKYNPIAQKNATKLAYFIGFHYF